MADVASLDGERADLIAALARHRAFLTQTAQGLTDEQMGLTPTASALCIGGLIKHTAATERQWLAFAEQGPDAFGEPIDWASIDWSDPGPAVSEMFAARERQFAMLAEDTAESVLAGYAEVAATTERSIAKLPDLGTSWELPSAPWFEPGARWTVRRALLHVLAETSQHAGHADILRESIDGQKTMG